MVSNLRFLDPLCICHMRHAVAPMSATCTAPYKVATWSEMLMWHTSFAAVVAPQEAIQLAAVAVAAGNAAVERHLF